MVIDDTVDEMRQYGLKDHIKVGATVLWTWLNTRHSFRDYVKVGTVVGAIVAGSVAPSMAPDPQELSSNESPTSVAPNSPTIGDVVHDHRDIAWSGPVKEEGEEATEDASSSLHIDSIIRDAIIKARKDGIIKTRL